MPVEASESPVGEPQTRFESSYPTMSPNANDSEAALSRKCVRSPINAGRDEHRGKRHKSGRGAKDKRKRKSASQQLSRGVENSQ